MSAATRRRRGRVVTAFAVAVVAALGWLVAGASAASAHASVTDTVPARGSRVDAAPATVTLRFTEPVGMSSRSVEVLDAEGRRVDRGRPAHPGGDARAVAVRLGDGLSRGTYTVVYRVVSADSHPVAGTYAFGLGVQPGAVTATGPRSSPDVVAVHYAARLVALAATVGLVGVAVFCLVVWPVGAGSPRAARLVRTSWWAAAASTGVLVLVQGPYGAGLGLGGVLDPGLLGSTLATRYGQLVVLRAVVLAVAVPLLRRCGAGERTAVLPLAGLGALYLLTFSLSEHAGQGRWALLRTLADAVHAGAAAVWLGGLATLLVVVLRPRTDGEPAADPATMLPRWSRTATAAVALLVATGLVQAWREVGETAALTGTRYGWLLVAKVAVVVVMLAVAASARRLVHAVGRGDAGPTLAAGPAGGAGPDGVPDAGSAAGGTTTATVPAVATRPDGGPLRRLRGRVLAEAVGGLLVLVVTAVLVNTVPAKDSYDVPFSTQLSAVGVEGDSVRVILDLGSTRAGLTAMRVRTFTSYGDPLPFAAASASFTEPAQRLGPVTVDLPAVSAGVGTTDALLLPSPGTWRVTVRIRTDDSTAYTATTTYRVR